MSSLAEIIESRIQAGRRRPSAPESLGRLIGSYIESAPETNRSETDLLGEITVRTEPNDPTLVKAEIEELQKIQQKLLGQQLAAKAKVDQIGVEIEINQSKIRAKEKQLDQSLVG